MATNGIIENDISNIHLRRLTNLKLRAKKV